MARNFKVQKTNFYGDYSFLAWIFARYGLPDDNISENASQFTAGEFKKFYEAFVINHIISPAYE